MASTKPKRTWSGLLLYTLCSIVWVYAYQVVFVGVLLVGIFIALCTCKVRNLLSGVSRAVWQVELRVHSLYVTDSALSVPRVEAITLGSVWWTFVYFFMTKAIQAGYYTAFFSTTFNDYMQYRAESSPEAYEQYRVESSPDAASNDGGKNALAQLVLNIVAWFFVNIMIVWLSTWWTNMYYTWMVSDLARKEETRQLPHFHPYRLPNATDAAPSFRLPFPPPPPPPPLASVSSQNSNGSVVVMGAPPPYPPQLEQKTSSQSSLSSVGSAASVASASSMASHPTSMDSRAMPLNRSQHEMDALQAHWHNVQAVQSGLQPGAAMSAQPHVHFTSTLTERHGVLGFPVPPPPLRSAAPSGAPFPCSAPTGRRRDNSQTSGGVAPPSMPPQPPMAPQAPPQPPQPPQPPASVSKRKKAEALQAKHEHKLESMADHARHQIHALHRVLSTVKSHRDTNAIENAHRRLAALTQLVAHAHLSPDERLQFELACQDVAEALDSHDSLHGPSKKQHSQSTNDVYDQVVATAQANLGHLQAFWTTQSPDDHETVSELRRQLDAIVAALAPVPPTWRGRQALEQQCQSLDGELAAWLERRDNEKNALRGQLNAIRQTLDHGAGLSDANKAQLQQICQDLQAKLAALDRPPPSKWVGPSHVLTPPQPSTAPDGHAASAPEVSFAQGLVNLATGVGGSGSISSGGGKALQRARSRVSQIVRQVTMETDEGNDVHVSTPDDKRQIQVTQPTRSGWQSPSGYDHPAAPTYGALSPAGAPNAMPSFAASTPAYGQLSPTTASSMMLTASSATFAAPPTFRSAADVVDPVHFLSFAPPTVCRGMVFNFSIWAFLVHQREEAVEEAQAADSSARQLSRELLLRVRRGAMAHVTLQLPSGFRLDKTDPTQVLAWNGDVTSVRYGVECTAGAPVGQVLFKATIVVGTDVLIMRSYVSVAAAMPLDGADGVRELESNLEVLPKTYTEIPFDDLSIHELVGRGHFGDAYRAEFQGKQVVVKTIRASVLGGDSADQIVQEFRHEAAVLNMFGHHPHIVPFVGASTDPSSTLSLVTEYLPYGTIEDQYRRHLTAAQKTRIVADAAAGLVNMHEGGFIHRDIAARNCLVDADLRAKVCDFGLCRRVDASSAGAHFDNGVGPLKYMAPESLQPPHVFSTKSDAFAFGVLVWETFAEKKPFAMMTAPEAAAYVLEGGRLDHTHVAIPPALQNLMAQCFQEDPTRRPTMADIAAACRRIDLTLVD